MKDILEELGLNFKSHSLSDSNFEYNIERYIRARSNFTEALHHVHSVFSLKGEPVPVKTFVNSCVTPDNIYGTITDQFRFWQEIKDFIKLHENDNWIFNHFEKGEVDLSTDPYDDYANLHEAVTVYAWIKSDDQPTTEEQQKALNYLTSVERDLIFAKNNLEGYLK